MNDDFFDRMDGSWSSAWCIETIALKNGLDPSGSMHGYTQTAQTAQDFQKRISNLVAIRMIERPDLPIESLPIPPPLAWSPGCTFGTHETLRPFDYMGLGIRNGAFSFQALRDHCKMAPNAARTAVEFALCDANRHLVCQRIRCNQSISTDSRWTICTYCMLSVYCGTCKETNLPCRYCLQFVVVRDLPNRWLFDRAQEIARFNQKYRFEETDVAENVIFIEAQRALYSEVERVSRRAK